MCDAAADNGADATMPQRRHKLPSVYAENVQAPALPMMEQALFPRLCHTEGGSRSFVLSGWKEKGVAEPRSANLSGYLKNIQTNFKTEQK